MRSSQVLWARILWKGNMDTSPWTHHPLSHAEGEGVPPSDREFSEGDSAAAADSAAVASAPESHTLASSLLLIVWCFPSTERHGDSIPHGNRRISALPQISAAFSSQQWRFVYGAQEISCRIQKKKKDLGLYAVHQHYISPWNSLFCLFNVCSFAGCVLFSL